MCLILLAWQCHPDYPLLVAANRDEYYQRPTRDAAFWPEDPDLLAGKDLEAGGTWLGIHRRGRFAAITNFRGGEQPETSALSRGLLPLQFLRNDLGAREYARQVQDQGSRYAGFNLLLIDGRELVYCSNVDNDVRSLPPGIYGLSNALLDTPWPKVERGRAGLESVMTQASVDVAALADTVSSRERAPDHELPDTGVGLEAERWLSAQFIHVDGYGTRATTGLSVSAQGAVSFLERNFSETGEPARERRHEGLRGESGPCP